ncbi:hypothetical protein GCM10008083_32160 [Ulvibacter litoralis]|nr:hypothetical protein GCM10008083_32160 [Ulvibacter litoralis]
MAGTAGGTLASTIPNIGNEHIVITCILAVIGATVSFVITLVLKKIVAYISRIKKPTIFKSRK